MARRKTTVYLDEEAMELAVAEVHAVRSERKNLPGPVPRASARR